MRRRAPASGPAGIMIGDSLWWINPRPIGCRIIYDTTSPKQAERSKKMRVALDKKRFGPWAVVTGASSGIGKEFARQIAAAGINVVLVARRDALLAELGRVISQEFDVQYRALAMDLSQEGFIERLDDATYDLDIG